MDYRRQRRRNEIIFFLVLFGVPFAFFAWFVLSFAFGWAELGS